MDLFDVENTIREFREEWNLRHTPNDLKFWAPRLESEFPTEQICAELLVAAWGLYGLLEKHAEWKALAARSEQLWSIYEEESKYDHYGDESDHEYKQWEESLLTWPEYFAKNY